MNYLAHLYLARHSQLAMIGQFLGDFEKHTDLAALPGEVRREVFLHRAIDSYTDGHPETLAARSLFRPGPRRFAGVLLDVFYDHFLARDWDAYCPTPLPRFTRAFYEALIAQEAILPPHLKQILPRLLEQDWLGSYADLQGIEVTIRRMSRRLSKHGDVFCTGIEDFTANYAALEQSFGRFFPELCAYVEEYRARSPGESL